MNYWIFQNNANDKSFSQQKAYEYRMKRRLWGYDQGAPNSKHLLEGDRIIFYHTHPWKALAGTAVIASTELTEEELATLAAEQVFRGADDGVLLAEIDVWPEPVKNEWGQTYRQGMARITKEYYELITHTQRTG